MLAVGSLFSGIGGLEVGVLAALSEARIPWRLAWQIERDPFCSRVLAHHFPDVTRYCDVETCCSPEPVEVLVGGFACQDVSAAGLGRGLGLETRSGNTWHHVKRIIRETGPAAIVVENVASGAKRWLPQVVRELGDLGYRPHAVPLGALHVGAPHRRMRVFVVALADSSARRRGPRTGLDEHARQPDARERGRGGAMANADRAASRGLGGVLDGEREALWDDASGCGEDVADRDDRGYGLQERQQPGRGWRSGASGAGEALARGDGAHLAMGDATESRRARAIGSERTTGERRPAVDAERSGDAGSDSGATEPGLGGRADGLPFDVAGHAFPAGRGETQYDWEPPRTLAQGEKVADRPARLRALGNAVVPQCSLVVGRVLVALLTRTEAA